MNERAQTLVNSAGLNEAPLTALERGDSIFVLTRQTLLYQDAAGTRRVTLRDLTRIHSDQDGQLRVETPAGTALTASLLGYDPVAVQTFFAQVRDATAAVKQPQPQPQPAPAPALPPRPTVSPASNPVPTSGPLPTSNPVPTAPPTPGHDSVTVARTMPQATPAPAPAQPMPGVPLRPVQPPTPGVREVREPAAPRPAPVFQPAPAAASQQASRPDSSRPDSSQPKPRPEQKTEQPKTEQSRPAPAEALPSLVTPVEIPAEAAAQTPDTQTASDTPLNDLAGRASQTGAWVGRLRFLSVVMLLAAFALAYLQFRDGLGLSAVWVLIAGGIAAVALYALADLTRLLVGMAQSLSDRRNDL